MFCKLVERESLGIGKLSQIGKIKSTVEFFISPTENPLVVEEENKNLRLIELCAETRAYVQNESNGLWKAGRVLVEERKHVRIQFPNRQIENVPVEQVFIRCNVPISEPVNFLSNFINYTPIFSEARRKFVRAVLAQRSASKGMSGLISSIIELASHQVCVVEKILKDPVQRYLLADEVGLGKTIEAGVVIRQFVLDSPHGHNIVVITPQNLVMQWQNELSEKFLLGHYLDKSIHVISKDNTTELRKRLPKAKMLVVDEVHQIVKDLDIDNPGTLYKLVCLAAHQAERLLLLSATPVFGNEVGYLAMLHMLDPVIYELSDLDAFKTKITNRLPLMQLIAEISADNLFFLGDSIAKLKLMFPEDTLLTKYAEQLEALLSDCPTEPNEDIELAISTIRAHVSETYKLHRRILRNRRRQVSGVTPDRKGFKFVYYQSAERSMVINILDQWRNAAVQATYSNEVSEKLTNDLYEIFASFIEALFWAPENLLNLIETRLNGNTFFTGEEESLQRLKTATTKLMRDTSKHKSLVEMLIRLVESNKKVIIFCTVAETVDEIATVLARQFPNQVVSISHFDNESQSQIELFLGGNHHPILICDQTAEEGLNLHEGDKNKVIVHYDLPLSPNRIEQRIGRLDRYGFMGNIRCYGIVCQDDIYENEWAKCLDEGFGVFNHSVASLQYLIDSEIKSLRQEFLAYGVEAIEKLTQKIGGESGLLVKELQRIDLQDQLDSIQEEGCEEFDLLEDVDCEWKQIENQIDTWTERYLLFKKIAYHVEEPLPPDRVFRFQYNYDAHQNTLLPLDKFVENFLPVIDLQAGGGGATRPRSFPFAYRRETAIYKKVQLLRYGNPFIDGMMDFTSQDDRGKCFALWRCAPTYSPHDKVDCFFRFDFTIEVDLNPIIALAKKKKKKSARTIVQAMRRQGDVVLPPLYQSIWINGDYEAPENTLLHEFLEVGYSKVPRGNGTFDRNINNERWEAIWHLNLPVVRQWSAVCHEANSRALEVLTKRTNLNDKLKEALNQIKIHDMTYFAQRNSRLMMLSEKERLMEAKEIRDETDFRQALCQGIEQPRISIDSIGAVFLSNVMPFE